MKELYKLSASGAMQVWLISGSLSTCKITIHYGQHLGALQTQIDDVEVNKSGRGLKEQMLLQMKARITKQRAKGYRDTMEEASTHKNLNALNLHKPMLAQRWDKVSGFVVNDCFRQHKLDGHRMLVTNTGTDIIAYTRNGKIIDNLDHITREMDIPEGMTVDGEVYHHGAKLQTIASWCKRLQPDTVKLKYHVYDAVLSYPYLSRLNKIKSLNLGKNAQVVDTWKSKSSVTSDLRRSVNEGYEGLILRRDGMPYGAGKRCKSLIKVKEFLDAEFKVINIHKSKDGWAILECHVSGMKFFRVSAPGTIEEKSEVLRHSGRYIGKWINVEYFSLTNEGIPFHPVATYWRDISQE